MKKAEAVVIGGGVQGLMAAYYLSKLGVNVTVLEKSYLGAGSSGRNHGGIRSTHDALEETLLGKLSLELWGSLVHELGCNIEFRQHGYLFVAYEEEQVQEYKRQVSLHNKLGIASEYLDPRRVIELAPVVCKDRILGGMFYGGNGSAYPFAFIRALAAVLKGMGCAVLPCCEVRSMEKKGGTFILQTAGGKVEAAVVVDAAGVGAKDIAHTLGVTIPTHPVKRQSLATERVQSFISPLLVTPWGSLVQTVRGEVLATCPEECEVPSDDFSTTRTFVEKTASWMCRVVPDLRYIMVIRQWAGHYDITPDRRPIVDQSELEGFYLSVGWPNYGFMMAPASGKLLANFIVNGKRSDLLTPYRIERSSLARDRGKEIYQCESKEC